jgi:hypothetical protein
MSKQFWSFLVVGLVIVGAAVALIWSGTKSNHLDLDTKFLNVRAAPLGDGNELVIVDFRVTNTSGIPLVIREVSMNMELYGNAPLKGLEVSRSDVDTMFQSHPLLGAKDNEVLAPPETIPPGKTIYRMAEASFEASESAVSSRKAMVVHIEDVDGAAFDISEKKDEKK